MAVAAVLGVSGANAAGPTVLLTLSVSGAGSVKITNEPAVRCTGTCHATFRVKLGSRVVVVPKPTAMWKAAPWTGACTRAHPTCTLRLTKAQHVSVRFVPPGAATNAIPLHATWFVPGNWLLEVEGVTPNANSQVLDPDGNPLQIPTGAQFFMLDIAATYKGSGTANFADFAAELTAVAARKTYAYTSGNGCGPGKVTLPLHDIQPKATGNSPVEMNQTVTGNICFQIAPGDAASLELAVGGHSSAKVWYSLH